MAATADGHVYTWGRGYRGVLGHGNETNQHTPKLVEALVKERVVAVAAGGNHSVMLSAAGRVYTCGHGTNGQLGHGDTQHQSAPKLVGALAGEQVVEPRASALEGVLRKRKSVMGKTTIVMGWSTRILANFIMMVRPEPLELGFVSVGSVPA